MQQIQIYRREPSSKIGNGTQVHFEVEKHIKKTHSRT